MAFIFVLAFSASYLFSLCRLILFTGIRPNRDARHRFPDNVCFCVISLWCIYSWSGSQSTGDNKPRKFLYSRGKQFSSFDLKLQGSCVAHHIAFFDHASVQLSFTSVFCFPCFCCANFVEIWYFPVHASRTSRNMITLIINIVPSKPQLFWAHRVYLTT